MSIVPMRKATICARAGSKRDLVAGLQDLGCLHVVPLTAPEADALSDRPSASDANKALRYLVTAPYVRQGTRARESFDFAEVVQRVLANRERRRELLDERDDLKSKLAALAPWGDFALPDSGALGGYQLWFYAVPHRRADALDRIRYSWFTANRTQKTHYIVVLAREAPPSDMLPVTRTPTDGRGPADLRRDLAETEAALEDADIQRIQYTRYIPAIRRAMARARDRAQFHHALSTAHDADGVFVLQAWVPATAVPAVRRFTEHHGAAALIEKPAPDEQPPTLLDNPEAVRPGEDLAHFYQVPSARDWDPSGVLLASFALFFAIILSDAAYGAVVLAIAVLPLRLWRSATGARVRRMVAALGAASAAFGVLAGSYFGITPAPGTLPGMLNVVDLRDYTAAMELSVIIGVLHVVLANAAWAWAHWPRRPSFARLGWIAVAVGGYAAWLTLGSGPPFILALGTIGAGIAAVVAFGSDRAVKRPLDYVKRGLDGVLHAANLTKLFGDVLSYLRLFALGLATAMLAAAFNDIARQVAAGMPGLGLFLALLVALLGHALTFILGVVSGVVHGLRLDYIEFYGWALSGEGYPFRPLQKTENAV